MGYQYGRDANGNPTRFTPEVRTKLIQAARMGLHPKVACQAAGISVTTYRGWVNKGEKASSLPVEELTDQDVDFLAFYEAINEAEAAAEIMMVATWREGAKTDWKAAKEFLARRHPDRWGQRVEINVNQVDEEILELLEAGFDDEDYLDAPSSETSKEDDIVDAEVVAIMPPPKELETGNQDGNRNEEGQDPPAWNTGG